MRLRKRDLITVYHKKRIVTQDDEANPIVAYEDEATPLLVNLQSASGSVNAQIYSERLSSMKSCKYQGDFLKEGQHEMDGVCVYVDKSEEPDYKIVSIQPFSTHTNVMLERIGERDGH